MNLAWRLLLGVASAGPLVLTTGRGRGDEGQRTFKGAGGQFSTRPDHVLMSGDLFDKLVSVHINDTCGISDHNPVHLVFPAEVFAEEEVDDEVVEPGPDNGVRLRWCPDRENDYGVDLLADDQGRAAVTESVGHGDVNGAYNALVDMIERAASSSGMVAPPRTAPPRKYPAGKRRPAWFDEQCREAKRRLRWAVKWGRAREQLVREYKRVTRDAKRRFEQLRAARLLDMLKTKDPEAYRLLQQRPAKHVSPIKATKWKEHIQQHFGQPGPISEADNRAVRRGLHRVALDERGVPRDVVALGRRRQQGGAKPDRSAFQLPDRDRLLSLVAIHVRNMRTDSSAGPDALPSAFIRNARVRVGESGYSHALVPLLCDLIGLCLRKGCIPDRWKLSRIAPLHKKGDTSDPNNYRLLTVSSCVYRLYANVVRDLMTTWCVTNHTVPDAQFGFYPGRNTLQPMFILRHLIHAARHRKLHKQVYAAFIDFTQAYDTVDRAKLWSHLEGIGMPKALLAVARSMYAGDAYELVDGEKRTGQIRPARGVRQGCPLSPLLFSLYVNEVFNRFPQARGARAGVDGRLQVSHLMYADDLTLLANSASDLQFMLDSLARYAEEKGLTVNVSKSHVVVFNGKEGAGTPDFVLGDQGLDVVREFKYLGVVFDEKACMSKAAEYAARPFMAGIKRVSRMADEHCVRDRPHAMLWLFQSFALPAGTYGAQIWSTKHLVRLLTDAENTTDIHMMHACFVKRVLRVKRTVVNHVALREAGQIPMHFYWLRSVIRFWNAIVKVCNQHDCGCPLLRDVVRADLQLAGVKAACWSKEVSDAISCLPFNGAPLASNLSGCVGDLKLLAVEWKEVAAAFDTHTQGMVWGVKAGGGDPRDEIMPGGSARKWAVYDQWMAEPWSDEGKPPLPRYLYRNLPVTVLRDMSRFRTSAHHLRVETGRWERPFLPWQQRVCDLCDLGAVQDEQHVLLECTCTGLVGVRNNYPELLKDCGGQWNTMNLLMRTEKSDDLAWCVHRCLRFIEQRNDVLSGSDFEDGEQPEG